MKQTFRLILIALGALVLSMVGFIAHGPAAGDRAVYVLKAVGSVNPGLAEFIVEGIRIAEAENAEVLVIELDTPGGLDASMRQIVQAIAGSKVPVVVYVYPRGARAASAGVFVTIAAEVAAMAPGTNIGAAHPVSIGMGAKMDKTMEKKVVNDFVAYGRATWFKAGALPVQERRFFLNYHSNHFFIMRILDFSPCQVIGNQGEGVWRPQIP